jgi:hypothetical protein
LNALGFRPAPSRFPPHCFVLFSIIVIFAAI